MRSLSPRCDLLHGLCHFIPLSLIHAHPLGRPERLVPGDEDVVVGDGHPSTTTSAGGDRVPDPDFEIKWLNAREAGGLATWSDATTLARANGLLSWRRNTRFCHKCGSGDLLSRKGGLALGCPTCHAAFYPQVGHFPPIHLSLISPDHTHLTLTRARA